MVPARAIALALVPAAVAGPGGRTLWVGEGHPYATPAAAVAAAVAGDTIRVAAGIYTGALEVDRPVVLVGEPGAVLDGGGRGTVVTIVADSVELRGFRIRGSGRSLDHDEAAVKVVRCSGCRVIGNHISESLHGVYLLESNGTLVAGNVILGDSLLPEPRRGNGVHLFHANDNRLEGNTIRRSRDGIYFAGSSGNVVVGNDVSRVRYGLHYMYSDGNAFEGNRFTRNAAGAAIMVSKRITLRGNVFAEHIGYRAYGLLLQTAEEIVVERNRVEGNLVGFFLDAAVGNVFRENAVVGNGVGIELMASSEGNVFTANAIVGNRTAVRSVLGAGENRWAEGGRGNYWGDRRVFDLDGDGVGDRPYRAGDFFGSLAAMRPVLEVFSGTPAAVALSWAEEAFQVFDLSRVEDPAPLVAVPAGVPGARGLAGGGRGGGPLLGLGALPLLGVAVVGSLGLWRALSGSRRKGLAR